MADILIKGMEMPSCCGNCQFNQFHEANHWTTWYSCTFLNKDTDDVGNNRLADCPLVALPEHGRLIDGDKLLSIFRHANKDCYQIGKYERASQWYDAEGFVEMQKTIVEATE